MRVSGGLKSAADAHTGRKAPSLSGLASSITGTPCVVRVDTPAQIRNMLFLKKSGSKCKSIPDAVARFKHEKEVLCNPGVRWEVLDMSEDAPGLSYCAATVKTFVLKEVDPVGTGGGAKHEAGSSSSGSTGQGGNHSVTDVTEVIGGAAKPEAGSRSSGSTGQGGSHSVTDVTEVIGGATKDAAKADAQAVAKKDSPKADAAKADAQAVAKKDSPKADATKKDAKGGKKDATKKDASKADEAKDVAMKGGKKDETQDEDATKAEAKTDVCKKCDCSQVNAIFRARGAMERPSRPP